MKNAKKIFSVIFVTIFLTNVFFFSEPEVPGPFGIIIDPLSQMVDS